MKLLQVPTAELEQRIKQEIEENPALEEGRMKTGRRRRPRCRRPTTGRKARVATRRSST